MNFFGFSELRTSTRVYWSILLVATLAATGVAIASASEFAFFKLAVLLSAAFIAVLMSQFELRVPKTQIEISAGHIISIWAIFWLGVSGGVLIAVAAASARLFRDRKFSAASLVAVFLTIISLSTSALAFSFLYPSESEPGHQWNGLNDIDIILIGSSLMATVSFVAYSVLDIVYRMIEGSITNRFSRTVLRRAIEILPVAGATAILCALFAQFGLSFGLVVVPLAVFAILAYRIHLKRLQQKTAQILEASRVHLATVEALATAIDARDQVGHGHVRRTQIYAVGLGEVLGLGDGEIDALRSGALLHDIGKLAVPDHILSKAGPLTPAELEKTKIHATVGASILERVDFPYPVVPTVKHHHECWDGKGYPDGLAGEAIPLTARILAVADTFDTLLSDRPFRPAMSREKAREHLIARSGTQFDPSLVRVFLKNLPIFETEIERQGLAYEVTESSIGQTVYNEGGNFVDQIKLANKEVFTLFELAREFGSAETLSDVLALFTQKVSELIPFDTCAVYLLDSMGKNASAAFVVGENKTLLFGRRIKVGEGATGIVLKKQSLIKNVNPDLDFSLSHLELIQQYSTMASLPLFAEEQLIGAISLYSHNLSGYGDEHIRLLETISRIAAEAITKSQQHAETKAHALTDPMTGLPNARSLQIQFEKEIGRSTRSGNNFQVIVMDLDGFKAVNDTFGHKVGDEMLREVGKVIKDQLREYDFLSRYGGDEFVALIPEAEHEMVADLCTRIETAVCNLQLPVDNGRFANVGVSLGSAGFPQQGQTFDQMIVAADKAMYLRKSSRKLSNAAERKAPTAPMSAILAIMSEDGTPLLNIDERPSSEGFIVELDESHVIMTASVN